ncbi:MAG: GDP-L-fucose synthase [Alphaproteobacteria bacterium]|jgi:GDP-L-fucose synthase|nr:GDP-L-fucose synthase [Alphaproteobacteria bacterium]MBU1549475.1 GDP-L-fucose synthase [Alphaproteobacteria bacterium]MBU2336988.1 GDP-L-fucose synthase [Alphaproteobacteria bacterium]MBU2391427.1 GDP-L-fucose synthase [Alphaproteobacteria bacterium]
MGKPAKIYVAGHRGMVGAAIVRTLSREGNVEILKRTRAELDLTDQREVQSFFASEKPDQVYLAAARVGGIYANNTYPADFIYDNLMIEANVIHAAHMHGVEKLLFLGSSCIYPRAVAQPMSEDALLTGVLEPTNEPYAIAKIAGIKLCESYNRQHGRDFRSVMPTNLYGPGDNYHLENSHVLPAMIRKFHLAKLAREGNVAAIEADEKRYGPIPPDVCRMIGLNRDTHAIDREPNVVLWGTGTPYREFLHVDDMADACIFVMQLEPEVYRENTQPMLSHINVGFGSDLTIRSLSSLVASIVGYDGSVVFDEGKPDGTPRKLMDIRRIEQLGWQPRIGLDLGIRQAYEDYLHGLAGSDASAPHISI